MTTYAPVPLEQEDVRGAGLGMAPGPSRSGSVGPGQPALQHNSDAEPAGRHSDMRSDGGLPAAATSSQDQGTTCRTTIGDLLDKPESSFGAQVAHYVIIFVILASTLAVIMETIPELHMNPSFFPLEMCITALFTIEFSLRLYACDSLRAFAMNGFNVVDFLAILPGYIELLLLLVHASENSEGDKPETELTHVHKAAGSMRTLRMIRIIRLVRVFRVLRIAKVARHSQTLSIIFSVFVKVSQSGLVVVLMLLCFAMVLSASLVYIFESELCENEGIHCAGPSAFVSIPAAFWWSIATLTTVGYGDMVPHTVGGKIIGALTAVAGVIVVAIGIALVSINFRECFLEEQARAERRRRGGRAASSQADWDDEQELQQLVESFEHHSAALLDKLRNVTEHQKEARQLHPMLNVLSAHNKMLSSDVKAFVNQILVLHDASRQH